MKLAECYGFYLDQQFYLSLEAETVPITSAVRRLARAYFTGNVLPRRKLWDALHVALDSTAQCDALLSWDGDIVKPSRVAAFNQVNLQLAYPPLHITLPDIFLKTYP